MHKVMKPAWTINFEHGTKILVEAPNIFDAAIKAKKVYDENHEAEKARNRDFGFKLTDQFFITSIVLNGYMRD